MRKALKNWRKFGVIIFGSILVASTLMPQIIGADDFRVSITDADGRNLESFAIAAGNTRTIKVTAYKGTKDVTSDTTFLWSTNASYKPSELGKISSTGGTQITYTAGTGKAGSTTATTYSAAITVTGNYGTDAPKFDAVGISVNPAVIPANQPPVAKIAVSPTSGTNSLLANLNASASTDADGTIVKYEWDYDGNGTYDYNSGNDATVSHTYGIGTWYPKVRVTDDDGATGVAVAATPIVVVEVQNRPWTLSVNPVSDVLTLTGSSVGRDFNPVAHYTDSTGGNVTLTSTTWQVVHPSSNSANGSINANGYYTATHTGNDQIKLTASDGKTTKTAWANIEVVAEPEEQTLAYVVVDPIIKYLNFYQSYQFHATAYDQDNNQIPDSQVTYRWDVVNAGGTINHSNGTFTSGNDDGTFDHTVQVKATMNGVVEYAYATVVVNPIITQAVLERVEILPSSITINNYDEHDFTAYAYDTNNAQMFSDVTYTWDVIAGPGSVDQNGTYTATNSDNTATVQVEARQGSIRVYDTAYVYIRDNNDDCSGILDHVVITPSTGYVQTGHSIDYDAQAYDTTGCLVSADLDFSLVGSVPGTINDSGYFTANYTTGTYDDDVKVRAYHDGVTVYDWATVVISDSNNNQNYYVDSSLRAYDETIGSDYKANEGDTVLYTLKLTNNRSNTLTSVRATMDVPDYTTFVSVSASNGTPSISNRAITWELGSLASGETKTMWLRVRVKDGVPSNTVIRGKAFVKAYEISNGFYVYANDLPVNGTGNYNPIEPLTPTGAMEWILAVITALLATIFTRQLFKTRRLLAQR
ncbi:MAG: PKD domain-containing protein [Patescibacteria group bacterium]